MNRTTVFVLAIFLACAGIAQASQQDKKTDAKEAEVTTARNTTGPPAESKPAPVQATTDPAYIIGPEDVLDIRSISITASNGKAPRPAARWQAVAAAVVHRRLE